MFCLVCSGELLTVSIADDRVAGECKEFAFLFIKAKSDERGLSL